MTEIILKNARLILSDEVVEGNLHIKSDRIASIDTGICNAPEAVDCEGDYISPGFIELHTDNIERHLMPRPNSFWPVEAAVLNHDRELASVGITTVFNAICVGDVNAQSLRLELLQELTKGILDQFHAGTLKIDHYIHLRCEASYGGMLDLLDPLIGKERVRMISVMDHTPGQRQFVDIDTYAMYYQGKFGLTDAELQTFMTERKADQEKYSASNRRGAVERAHELKIAIASHDDATVEHVQEAIDDGIVIAEFPTTMEAAQASHDAGLSVLMGGPNIVRGKSHNGNLSARDLAGVGLLDIISSDYVPSSLLHAAVTLDNSVENVTLPEAIAKITSIPAKGIGLEDRGTLEQGLLADLVRFRTLGDIPVVRDVWRGGQKIA